ncbi:MAG TPA: anthranilate synthase component I [Clostridiales bacterium]|nr:anthranilate synthase component I [Clostridiales bacterium]
MKIFPTCGDIMQYAKAYNTIPVCCEIYADLVTPINILQKIAQTGKDYYLLESVEGGEKWGRYSFIGYNPVMRVTCKKNIVTIIDKEKSEIKTHKPMDELRKILRSYKAPSINGLPPFTGGFVGYFAYSMIGYTEPTLKIKESKFNDFDVMLFDKVIAYDHLRQKIVIMVNIGTNNIMEQYGKACGELANITALISSAPQTIVNKGSCKPHFTCNVSKDEYCNIVTKVKEHIVDGDIFQAVISRQFVSDYTDSLMDAYRVLRTTNPSPYMVYLHMGDEEIISTSPETLVRLQNGRVTTFPVAGSRPRGKTELEDIQMENDLLNDEKELAEHNMLVDLGRNDLGRICAFGSVEVTKYKMVHKYSKIIHLCSQVEGNIASNCDSISAIESVLPAGTLSGAPKIKACQLIEKYEKVPRGIYGGALGYLDFAGNMDTCIAIRMAVKKDNKVYVQAGGGIVADSIPQLEYEESGNKARAVIEALLSASEVND